LRDRHGALVIEDDLCLARAERPSNELDRLLRDRVERAEEDALPHRRGLVHGAGRDLSHDELAPILDVARVKDGVGMGNLGGQRADRRVAEESEDVARLTNGEGLAGAHRRDAHLLSIRALIDLDCLRLAGRVIE
jgi:hypothetical protein